MRKSFLFVAKHGTIVPLLLFILTEPGVLVHFQCRSQMKTVLSYGPRLLIWTLFTQTKAALNKFRCSIATLGALSFKSIIHLHTHLRPFKSLPLLCTCHCKHDSSFDSSVEIQQFNSLHHLKNELIYWEKRSHCSNHLLIM